MRLELHTGLQPLGLPSNCSHSQQQPAAEAAGGAPSWHSCTHHCKRLQFAAPLLWGALLCLSLTPCTPYTCVLHALPAGFNRLLDGTLILGDAVMVIATELSSERLPLEQLPALGGVAVASWVIAGGRCTWVAPRPALLSFLSPIAPCGFCYLCAMAG